MDQLKLEAAMQFARLNTIHKRFEYTDIEEIREIFEYHWMNFENNLSWSYFADYYEDQINQHKLYSENNNIKEDTNMTNEEFRKVLKDAFQSHIFSKNREWHTVNELLYILEHDVQFKAFNFNISISACGGWSCIPTVDSFVPTKDRAVKFLDDEVEFEDEEFNGTHFHNITLYEMQ